MKSYLLSEEVLEALGDKVLEAVEGAVAATRDDLSLYRQTLPDFVASHSSRGLANWIHDRLWHHLVTELHGQDRVRILDSGPTREIFVDDKYRVRVKRHSRTGAVASYPTRAAIEFMEQPQLFTSDDYTENHLIIGYKWDQKRFEIGRTVLSMHDGIDNVVWFVSLGDEHTGIGQPLAPSAASPQRPVIDVRSQGGVTSAPEASGEHR